MLGTRELGEMLRNTGGAQGRWVVNGYSGIGWMGIIGEIYCRWWYLVSWSLVFGHSTLDINFNNTSVSPSPLVTVRHWTVEFTFWSLETSSSFLSIASVTSPRTSLEFWWNIFACLRHCQRCRRFSILQQRRRNAITRFSFYLLFLHFLFCSESSLFLTWVLSIFPPKK